MKHTVTIQGKQYSIQTRYLDKVAGDTDMVLKDFDVEQLQCFLKLYEDEFNKLYNNKKATALMIERVFKPEKYPEFHFHLDVIHELWIKGMSV